MTNVKSIDDIANSVGQPGFFRQYWTKMVVGTVGAATLLTLIGCTDVKDKKQDPRSKSEITFTEETMGDPQEFMDDLNYGFNHLRNVTVKDVDWDTKYKDAFKDKPEMLTAVTTLQSTTEDLATLVNGIDLLTYDLLTQVAGFQEELKKTKEGKRLQAAEKFVDGLNLEKQKAYKAARKARANIETTLNMFHKTNLLHDLKKDAKNLPKDAQKDLESLLFVADNYMGNVATRLHAQLFLRNAEALYGDREVYRIIKLSDDIQHARTGTSFTEAAEEAGVYDQALKIILQGKVLPEAADLFKNKPFKYRDKLIRTVRYQMANKLAKKGLPTDQLLGGLYILDQGIASEANLANSTGKDDTWKGFLIRLIPGVAAGDALMLAPDLFKPDGPRGGYVQSLKDVSDVYRGSKQPYWIVGDKGEIVSRFSVDLLVTAVEGFALYSAFSGGGGSSHDAVIKELSGGGESGGSSGNGDGSGSGGGSSGGSSGN